MNGRYMRELPARRADGAARGVHRPRAACATAVAIAAGEDPDAGRVLAAGRLPLRRPGRRRGGLEQGDRRRGRARRRSPRRARRWPRSSRSTQDAVEAALRALVERARLKPKQVYQPVRVAITGTTVSPGIFESVALLGRDETLRRIDAALARPLTRPHDGCTSSQTRIACCHGRTPLGASPLDRTVEWAHDPKPVGHGCR